MAREITTIITTIPVLTSTTTVTITITIITVSTTTTFSVTIMTMATGSAIRHTYSETAITIITTSTSY